MAKDGLPPELQAIQDDRQGVYGPWRDNMEGTSLQIDGMLRNYDACHPDTPLPEWWAPLCMVAVKLNRIASGNYKKDNFDDLIVYLHFVKDMQKKEAEK